MKRLVATLIVERAWPLALAIYSIAAAVATEQSAAASQAFHLYTYDSNPRFSVVVYAVSSVVGLATTLIPSNWPLRQAFFLVVGFALTGRLVSLVAHGETEGDAYSVARAAFVTASLFAHATMEIDWIKLRGQDDS